METSKKQRDGLMTVGIKVSICLLFCLLATREGKAQVFNQAIYPLSGQQMRDKVRSVYTSQIGVREKQPNSGREVEQYLRYVNLSKGNPWCAAFVCWVLGQANIVNPRTGWSPGLFMNGNVIWTSSDPRTKIQEPRFPQNALGAACLSLRAQRGKRFPQNVLPNTGDIFGLYFPEKGRIAHVGFVDDWKEPWVTTVEGNTNVLGSREGDGVYRKRRLVRSVFKVAKYVD